MSFANTQYFAYAIFAILILFIIINRLNANYFKWIKAYWFYDRTWTSRISSLFYIISLFFLMISLLDLRGPEKKIKANLPDQRTIIVIDSSTSMLAEDVKPSRFVKSLQLARHFVKSAAGHQISIVLFSDIQKRLIPFTDDIDLIDSRLAALEKTNSVSGGSNISQAIQESVGYFEFEASDDEKSKTGNLLVFTDAEESEGEFKVDVPPNVNLAVVGVGTLSGSTIPLRWEDGSFRGYKTFKGEAVTTKLDENYIKKMGKGIKSFKYWVANSYSLPTDEIMNFFRSAYNAKQGKGDLRVRPVYSHYILIPAILFYCLSVLFGRFKIFKTGMSLILIWGMCLSVTSLYAGENEQEKIKPPNPEIKKDLEFIKSGKANRDYVLKVAEKMLKDRDEERATQLYSEYAKKNDEDEVRFNYATALLKLNRRQEAMPIVQDLMKNSKNEELKNKMRNNVLLSLNPENQKKNDEQKKDDQKKDNKQDQNENKNDKQNQKDNKDQKNQDQKKSENKKEDGKNNKDDKKNGKPDGKSDGQQKKPDKGDKPEDKKDNKKDEKPNEKKDDKKENKGNGKDKEEDQKPQGPSTLEEKEKEIEQKRKMIKTPAMIKQIMSDDRELQKKMMDTSTNERGEQKPKRDW